MSTPRRLLETEAALPAELRRALRAAPSTPHPEELQSLAANLGSALGLTLAAPVVPAAVTAKAAGIAGAAANKGLWAVGSWLLGGVAVGASVCALAVHAPAFLHEAAPAPSARATPSASPTPKAAVHAASQAAPSASSAPLAASAGLVAAPRRSSEPATSQSASVADAPESEIALVRRAQQAVTRNPSEALALAERHAKLFPNGVFVQEREVIAIDALLRLGRGPDARARSLAFNVSYPGSAHARRIQALLDEHAR